MEGRNIKTQRWFKKKHNDVTGPRDNADYLGHV